MVEVVAAVVLVAAADSLGVVVDVVGLDAPHAARASVAALAVTRARARGARPQRVPARCLTFDAAIMVCTDEGERPEPPALPPGYMMTGESADLQCASPNGHSTLTA